MLVYLAEDFVGIGEEDEVLGKLIRVRELEVERPRWAYARVVPFPEGTRPRAKLVQGLLAHWSTAGVRSTNHAIVGTRGRRSRHMRFTANGGSGGDVRHWAVETLGGGRRPCGDFEVVGARLRFHPRPNGRRPRTLTCRLAAPTRCSLRDDPVEVNARRCLQRWGICGG